MIKTIFFSFSIVNGTIYFYAPHSPIIGEEKLYKKTACMLLLLIMLTSMLTSTIIGTLKIANADNQSSDWNGDSKSWPMFRGDLSHSGYSSSTAPLTNKTLWTYKTGGPVVSSPAILGDVVYVGSADGYIYALNASNSNKLWSYQIGTPNGVYSSPAIANGVLYLSSLNTLFALNASSGSQIWNSTVDYTIEYSASSAVVNGIIYIGSISGDGHGNSYAFNATNGDVLWNFRSELPITTSPAVANGIVYVGSGYVQEINSVNGNIFALDALTGSLIWSFQTNGQIMSSPAVAEGIVYVSSTDGYLYALNASTGSKVWSSQIYSDGSSPAIAGGVLFTGSRDNLYALNASIGSQIWTYQTGGPVGSSLGIANGKVYIGSYDGNVYAFGGFGVSLTCSPNLARANSSVICTATIHPSNATGTITWNTSSSTGIFNSTQTELTSGNSTVSYTDQKIGEITITATYSGDSNNLPSDSSTTLTLTPNASFTFLIFATSNTTVYPYSNVSFNATVIDSNGKAWDVTSLTTWSVDPNSYGFLNYNKFYAGGGSPGNFTVTGTYLGSNSSSSFTIIEHGNPTSLSIDTPYSIILGNMSQAYTAIAHDSSGNFWDVSSEVNWSISRGAGGFWSGNLYTSAYTGNWRVTAAFSGLEATAPITVIDLNQGPKVSIARFGTKSTNMVVVNGSQFDVDIRVDNVSCLWAYVLGVSWSSNLELLGTSEGQFLRQAGTTLFESGIINNTLDTLLGGINCAMADSNVVNGSGVLATLTFQAVRTGNASINLEADSKLHSYDPKFPYTDINIPMSTYDGSVLVLSEPRIDFNHDFSVDGSDFIHFVDAYIHYYQNGTLEIACDLNHDGKIDGSDFIIFVSDYIAFWKSFSGS